MFFAVGKVGVHIDMVTRPSESSMGKSPQKKLNKEKNKDKRQRRDRRGEKDRTVLKRVERDQVEHQV